MTRSRVRRPRGTQYVVRDSAGMVRHTANTKHEALRPFKGHVLRAQRPRRDGKPMTMKKRTLWMYLLRRGWSCTYERLHAAIPARVTTTGSDATSSPPAAPTSPPAPPRGSHE